MLLPDIYHNSNEFSTGDRGGLTGDLGIFLSLLAFSMHPNRMPDMMPELMVDGEWQVHSEPYGRKCTTLRYFNVYVCPLPDTD
jgi:hypothetical protein